MSTTQDSSSDPRFTGQVKWFNTKAGYGFITVCDGEHTGKDIFVHFSSIQVVNQQYRYLVQGEYVDFNVVKPEGDKYEYHATNVGGVKGGPIMCETRRIAMEGQPNRLPPRRYRNSGEGEDAAAVGDAVAAPQADRVVRKRPARTNDAPTASATEDGFKEVSKKRSAPRGRSTRPQSAPSAR